MTVRHARAAALAAALTAALVAVPAAADAAEASPATAGAPAIELITLPSPGSPLVAVRLLFRAGSIHDPPGREGLAALTALMLGEAGTRERSYSELGDALYPMATSIDVDTDREVTLISGIVHRDTLDLYTDLLCEAVLSPGFAAADLERNRERLLAALTSSLRATNDELLGLELLQDEIFHGHPYGHPPQGSVAGLGAITGDDVAAFYRRHFTRGTLMLGVAGGYPEGYPEALAKRLSALPAGSAETAPLPPPPAVLGRRFTLAAKQARAVGIHFGYPLPLTRADADYYPLMVANSFLGEHRTSHGRLMQQLRSERGLNYGDYSYIEHYADPPYTSQPTPNRPRRQQYFSVWIRPVVPETAHFALRAALSEVDRLVERGLTEDEFRLTRDFLVNFSKLWTQSLDRRLGFHMDSRWYGMPYFIDEIERRLGELTVAEVNTAARRYLGTESYVAVIVTDDAPALAAALFADQPSPMSYQSELSAEILTADETIERCPVEPTAVEIVPVDQIFER